MSPQRRRDDARSWFQKKRVLIPAAVVAFVVIGGAIAGGSDTGDKDDQTVTASDAANESEPTTDAADAPVEAAPPAPPEPELTRSQENARDAADNYLDLTAFSRSGLIKQLEFEGYSTEDATFGVDAVNPDWNEQAVKSAENYLELTPFSRSGLIDQLTFEGFTPEQATYGVDQNGL